MRSPQTNTIPLSLPLAHSARAERSTLTVHAPHWQTQLWQRLVVGMMVGAAGGVQALSGCAALRFGDFLGRLAYQVAGRQRRRTLANLHLAYGNTLSPEQRDVRTRQIFAHFGRGIVDFLRAPARSVPGLAQSVQSTGWEHAEAALEQGKGMILVTGHIGNWELLGRWLATVRHVPLTVVAREPDNPVLASYLRTMRESAGFTVLNKGESARNLLRALRRGEAILILADQNSGDVFTPFFGIPAGTAAGPASLALHSGAALIPIYCVEMPDHSFQVICLPSLDTVSVATTNGSNDRPADVLRITTELNKKLERIVREYPEQWLWLHNRWKSAFEEKRRATLWTDDTEYATARERWSA